MSTALDKFRHYRPRVDYWILLAVLGLALFGLVMIGSASALVAYERFDGAKNYYYVGHQAMSLAAGMVVMIVVAGIDYHFWRDKAGIMLFITLGLLVAVFLPGIGTSVKGATRWIDIGILSFQPSELVKLTFVFYLAGWFEKRIANINFIPFLLIMAAMVFLIISQPDLGTLTIVVGIAAAMFFAAGGSYTQIAGGGALVLAAFFALIKLSPYRWQRLMVFLNPTSETQGAGYHINQALLAVGSGGVWGLGFGRSVQKYLYLPEPYTDSIFAIVAEELGFARAVLVVLVFIFLLWRGFRVAYNAPDIYGRLIATGIVAWIAFQAFVNIGAMTGLLPLTGVPLPFISYGGTSLIVTLAAVGVLLNISKQAHAKSHS